MAKMGMRMDQISDGDRNVLYTDMDVMWRETITTSEWAQMKPRNVFKYAVEGVKDSSTPKNTGVMMIDVKAFDSIRDEFVKFGRAHQFTFNAFDQGWINAFGRDELLTNRWNWKIYWGNSTG